VNKLDIKSILSRDYSEYSELVSKQNNWMNPDYLDKKYLHFSRPHSEPYYNPLGVPFHLVHIKELSWLNLFPTILARDGLISIAHFFFRFPLPVNIDSTLLLPKEAQAIIPKAWLSNTLLYKIRTDKEQQEKDFNTIYITGSINEQNYNLENLKSNLAELKRKYPKKNYKALVFDNIQLGKEYVSDSNHHNISFYNTLFEIFGSEIKFVNWQDSKENNFENCAFYEIEQTKVHYSDSFVSFNFLSKGTINLNSDRYSPLDKSDNTIRISKYHYLELSHPESSKESDQIWSEIELLKDCVLTEEKNLNRTHKDFSKVWLCTQEFESIITSFYKNETI
jgi:hypothetical protein